MAEQMYDRLYVLLLLAPLGGLAWIGMLRLLFWMLGVKPREMLTSISIAEGLFFGLLGFSSAYLVAALFSRFI